MRRPRAAVPESFRMAIVVEVNVGMVVESSFKMSLSKVGIPSPLEQLNVLLFKKKKTAVDIIPLMSC